MECVLYRVIVSMRTFYLALFNKAYSWSAKHEFDKQPSLYSAVLYVCALQFLNLITAVFLIESTGIGKIDVPKWVAALAPVCLFAVNWWWASNNQLTIFGRGGSSNQIAVRGKLGVNVYIATTLLAFVVAVVSFVYTAPGA